MAEVDPTRAAFGGAVAKLRGRRTQREVADAVKKLGRPTKYAKQSVISEVETGKAYVALEDVPLLAAALGVSAAQLLEEWAYRLAPEEVAAGLYLRRRTLVALEGLLDAVQVATTEFVSAAHAEPHDPAVLADLFALPERQQRRLFRLARMIEADQTDQEEGK